MFRHRARTPIGRIDDLQPADPGLADPGLEADASRSGRPTERARGRRLYAFAATCTSLATVLLWRQDQFRGVEARVVSDALSWFAGMHATALANQPIIWLHTNEPGTFGLQVTAECTSAFVVVGFLALTAILALTDGFRVLRLVSALAAAVFVVFAINLIRLAVIGVAASIWGLQEAFTVSHVYVGSVVTIIGVLAAIGAYLVLLSRGRRGIRTQRTVRRA